MRSTGTFYSNLSLSFGNTNMCSRGCLDCLKCFDWITTELGSYCSKQIDCTLKKYTHSLTWALSTSTTSSWLRNVKNPKAKASTSLSEPRTKPATKQAGPRFSILRFTSLRPLSSHSHLLQCLVGWFDGCLILPWKASPEKQNYVRSIPRRARIQGANLWISRPTHGVHHPFAESTRFLFQFPGFWNLLYSLWWVGTILGSSLFNWKDRAYLIVYGFVKRTYVREVHNK